MDDRIAIKGVGDALLITLFPGEDEQPFESLLDAIDEQPEFFRGAHAALQIADLEVGAAELGRLRERLSSRQVNLRAVLSTSPVTTAAAADLGLQSTIEPEALYFEPVEQEFDTSLPGEEAVLASRTLRSGNHIRHHGHVVVMGDVNPGAEIVAGGNVIIWGRLKGVVHAGAAGDESAVICALEMTPTQLRIAGHIALSPDRQAAGPEVAFVRDDQVVAEPWQQGHRPGERH